LPPSLGFNNPNPRIDFANSPFYVNDRLSEWKTNIIRRAGVSSFGVGGTNVHVIVEEHNEAIILNEAVSKTQLIPWSAKSARSREAYGEKLLDWGKNNPH